MHNDTTSTKVTNLTMTIGAATRIACSTADSVVVSLQSIVDQYFDIFYKSQTTKATLTPTVTYALANTSCTSTSVVNYTLSIQPNETLINITTSGGGGKSRVQWSPSTPIGTYNVSITASISQGLNTTSSFNLFVSNNCSYCTLTPGTAIAT